MKKQEQKQKAQEVQEEEQANPSPDPLPDPQKALSDASAILADLGELQKKVDEMCASITDGFGKIRDAATSREKEITEELARAGSSNTDYLEVFVYLAAEAKKKAVELEKIVNEAERQLEAQRCTLEEAAGLIVSIRYAREDITQLVERCYKIFNATVVECAHQNFGGVLWALDSIDE